MSWIILGFSLVTGLPASEAPRLAVYTGGEGVVRIVARPGEPPGLAPDGAPLLVPRVWPAPVWRQTADREDADFRVGRFRAEVREASLVLREEGVNGRLVQAITFTADGFTFRTGDAPLYGLGGGGPQFDRRGGNFPLFNGQWTPDKWTHGARSAVPCLISAEGWALVVVSGPGGFDLRGAQGEFLPPEGAHAKFDVIILDARDPVAFLRELSALTGPAALPPKWALGYLQSHRTLPGAGEMLAVADTFRAKKLPCDGLIYLGTGFCPSGWNTGHDSLEFNPAIFGTDPATLLAELHRRNFKIVAHVTPPPVEPLFVSRSDGTSEQTRKRWDGDELHGDFADATVDASDARHLVNYWRRHEAAFAAGIDGWWPDEGDWYDVASRFARHRMYHDGPLAARPDVRPWHLQRNGYLGVARHGGWMWSGDLESSWAALAAQVPVALNFSLSVSPFWGSDIGGWKPTPELTGELFVRWFQFGTFSPSFRGHGRMWPLRLPWGWEADQPAWPPEPAHAPAAEQPAPGAWPDERVEPICRRYLELRYRLLPYTYTLAREARDHGLPLMRALWIHHPADAAAAARGNEYLWGRDLLVAPVVERGATERRLYLPAGEWHDWWTGERVSGGREITRTVDLATLPLYVRAGAIIPLDPPRQHTEEVVTEPLTICVFPGADGEFTLYEDDGVTQAYLRGQGTWTRFIWDDARRQLRVERRGGAADQPRTFLVQVASDGEPRRLDVVDTAPVTLTLAR